jgi:hypothetical protein
MTKRISWGGEARLSLRPGRQGEKTIVLFRGQIVDAIYFALARPEDERPYLFISSKTFEGVLTWAEITDLSMDPEFPMMI